MDYKYIEQLMERYWAAETSLEEENILHAFFSQKDVPAALEPYRALFAYEVEERNEQVLGDDFDTRILSMTDEEPTVKAREIRLTQRLMPLFKAAAVVAIILTLGNAAQTPWSRDWDGTRIDYAAYQAQQADSAAIAASPVQAENVGDSISKATPAAPTY